MKTVAFLFLLFASLSASAEIFIVHCVDGICPSGTQSSNDIIVREIYTYSNNGETKFADWVAYRVTRETIGTSKDLKRTWRDDEFLEQENTLEGSDYNNANSDIDTDRGHQAPLAAYSGTVISRTTNIFPNITPQKKG